MAEKPAPVDIVDRYPLVVEVEADICDACPSVAHVQAYVYAELPSGRSIAMCAHHGRQHHDALLAQGAKIVDLSHLVAQ